MIYPKNIISPFPRTKKPPYSPSSFVNIPAPPAVLHPFFHNKSPFSYVRPTFPNSQKASGKRLAAFFLRLFPTRL